MTHNSIWIDWFKPSPWHSCFKLAPSRDMIYHKPIRRASGGSRTSSKIHCSHLLSINVSGYISVWSGAGNLDGTVWIGSCTLPVVPGDPVSCVCVFVDFPPILWCCCSVYFWAAGCCWAGHVPALHRKRGLLSVVSEPVCACRWTQVSAVGGRPTLIVVATHFQCFFLFLASLLNQCLLMRISEC